MFNKQLTFIERVDRKLSLSFGVLVLILMLTATGVASVLFAQLQKKEEDRLSGALATILGRSISRISFSGKYHMRLLVEEMRAMVPELAFISVETLDGRVIAHSDKSINDTAVSEKDAEASRRCLKLNAPVVIDGPSVKEIVLPYRSGIDADVAGTIRLGVNVRETRGEQKETLIKLLLLVAALTAIAIWVIFIISHRFGGIFYTIAMQLQAILDNSPALIYMKDRLGRYVFVNRKWADLFHTTNDAIKGKTDLEIFQPDIAQKFIDNDRRVFESNQALELEEQAITDDGLHYYHSIKTAVKDGGGNFYALCGISTDITEKKSASDELHRHREHLEELVRERTAALAIAKEEAESANRAKSSFLSNMSHELRTPLNSILGFSNLMTRDSGITPKQKENLEIILKSGEYLLAIINDILDIAKIEAGKVEVEYSDFDLGELIKDLIAMLRVRAEAKGLCLVLDQSSSFPRFICGDSAKLRQIITNLVNNSIKFTDSGQINVKLGVQSAEGENHDHMLIFEIRDTGIGIEVSDAERIFMPFVQLGHREGTGLGLAIARQYVQLLGGDIKVISEPGKGSIFRFAIAYRPVDPECLPKGRERKGRVLQIENADNYKILIVEDQMENRLLLKNILAPFGFLIREAVNGREGVDAFEQWRPHLVFMDRRMPALDGLLATKEIRSMSGSEGAVIVAVTAHAFKEDRQAMIDAGCNALIAKPFSEEEVFSILENHLDIKLIRSSDSEPDSCVALDPQMISGLAEPLRREFEDALVRLDMEKINESVEKIAKYDQRLADSFKKYAEKLDYASILKALHGAGEEK